MLTINIFLPLFTGFIILLFPKAKGNAVRITALSGTLATLILSAIILAGYDSARGGMQWITDVPWIPSINAGYTIGVDGLSLPVILLTDILMFLVMLYVVKDHDRAKEHAFLFLLMHTGLLGLFSSMDLLLFYLFFEVGLVPMYFIIGIFGSDRRKYAAMKFFLYTRAGSLAMLISFLALYLSADPHTFSLQKIIQAHPFAGSIQTAGFVMLGLLIGFGVKLPTFPLHNWLPDAHVEAPAEGSVILAGVQLKMGAYGILRVMIPALPMAVSHYNLWLILLGIFSMVYSALAAMAQNDLKRLIAYTSINHMGYVMTAAGIWGLTQNENIKQLALNGAAYQIISHGLLTGGMFFIAGMLQHKAGTRDIDRFGGLLGVVPIFSALLGILAFASLGLPGFSGFIAEFQVIGASVGTNIWAAIGIISGLILMTALYLKIVVTMIFGKPPDDIPVVSELSSRNNFIIAALISISLFLGILPGYLTELIESGTKFLTAIL
ncbi:MAG TPA: NADH-quinone oxidoreductase subunit M [Ignavibacteriaceae bacterium]|nr:NADH-quinone oxidoreductase subunit M [Ignavibacteriaceae bacterium]